jgi:hypothetical protein
MEGCECLGGGSVLGGGSETRFSFNFRGRETLNYMSKK